jgi:sugar transferase (PEP-CTERM/EpsH1 system associated)
MRVLVLTDRLPFPLSNGQNLRIYHFVKGLSDRHEFHLLTYGVEPHPHEIQSIFREIRAIGPRLGVPAPVPFMQRVRRAFAPDALVHFDPDARAALEGMLGQARFDLLWISGWEMLVYLPYVAPMPVLADIVDEGLLEYLHALRHPKDLPSTLVTIKRLIQTVRFERRYFAAADLCNVVADRDARWGRIAVPRARFAVVNNGVDTNYFAPGSYGAEPLSLVFEGNMGFRPNVDAAVHFITQIFPRIRQAVPGVRFYAVGSEPAPELLRLQAADVIVTGFVDDVRPYLGRSAVFVCPMRLGAGIKNKILQAWAMARAVVATPVACGGLRAVDGENLLVAASDEQFAASVVQLLNDPAKRESLGSKGRDTVLGYYTWERQSDEFDRVFHRTAEEFQKRGRHG